MYYERKIKCLDCDDILTLVFDSHNDQKSPFVCNCGKLEVSNVEFLGSFSYKKQGRFENIDESIIRIHYEDDYLIFDEDMEYLWKDCCNIVEELSTYKNRINNSIYDHKNKINDKELSWHRECEIYRYFEDGTDITIKVSWCLKSDKGYSERDRERKLSEIKEELIKFKHVLTKIKEDITLLSDVDKLKEIEDMYCRGVQVEKYNYILTF